MDKNSFSLPASIKELLRRVEADGLTLVLVTGVFDLLHPEHEAFLRRAKERGDILLVGIESDFRVRKIKGEGRPINNQQLRQENLNNLQIADGVFILPEKFDQYQDHLALIRELKPDVLAVSSHTPHLDSKEKIMSLIGGRVEVVLDQNPDVSTTKLVSELGNQNKLS